ncbi:hypothetical protein ISS42_03365 [Candidatus Shapirobacteria bacterium]|nr:hypothetical protein [Candidatus Shapirobacteria bacterium]
MNIQNSLNSFNPLIAQANQVAILVSGNGFDNLVAGISLALSLEAAGKKVDLFASQEPGENSRGIRGIEKVRTDFGQKDLQVVFDYPLENIEKVSSQEEGHKLKLVVKIKPEANPIRIDQVKVVSQDLNFEVGIMIGDESAFASFNQFSSRGNWVWLGQAEIEKSWAKVSLAESNTSFSEIAARIIQNLGLPFAREIASNLYEGIKGATNSFASLTSYKTLETAALCLKVVQGNGNQSVPLTEPVAIEQVEKKEGGLPSPRIFKGATTPRV